MPERFTVVYSPGSRLDRVPVAVRTTVSPERVYADVRVTGMSAVPSYGLSAAETVYVSALLTTEICTDPVLVEILSVPAYTAVIVAVPPVPNRAFWAVRAVPDTVRNCQKIRFQIRFCTHTININRIKRQASRLQ